MTSRIVGALSGGDRRSIGAANEVADWALRSADIVEELVTLLAHADPVVAMRAADALEKATRLHAANLASSKHQLLTIASRATQQEVRWHLAQILPRLDLTNPERDHMFGVMRAWLDDPSAIVRANSLEALVILAGQDIATQDDIRAILDTCVKSDSAAVQTRAKRLLKRL